MNKAWLIGEVTYLENKPNVTILLMRTTEQTVSGSTFTAATPPIKVFENSGCRQKIRKGDVLLVGGHYQRKQHEEIWYDEIIAYLVTKNLSLNLFLGTGNLGSDAQWTTNRKAVFFNVGCKRYYSGEQHTDWVRSVLFSPTEASVPLLQKGQPVLITGRMEQKQRELENGQKAFNTSLIVSGWQAFSPRS